MKTLKDNSYGATPVFRENGRYLILLVKHQAGHWAFPKGHLKSGESRSATAKRELQEETGLEDFDFDEKTNFIEHYSFEREGKLYEKEIIYYPVFARDKTITPPDKFKEEISECRWVTFDEALKLAQFDSTREVIRKVEEYLRLLE
ncbi:MAG: NUDIX domain-containing protein [Patescibacteria group bacterium]